MPNEVLEQIKDELFDYKGRQFYKRVAVSDWLVRGQLKLILASEIRLGADKI